MTDTPTTDSDAPTTDYDSPPGDPELDDADEPGSDDRSITEYAQWAVFGVLVLVGVIATLRFYFSMSAAINQFVTREYRPLFTAGFNLIIVLACALGVSVLVRRLA